MLPTPIRKAQVPVPPSRPPLPPSRQARGLGIEEGPLRRMRRCDGAVGERIQQVRRQLVQVRDIHAPVTAVPLEQLLGFEVLAARRVYDLAADESLDEVACRAFGPWWDRLQPVIFCHRLQRWDRLQPVVPGPLLVDARDAPPQYGELFLDILHCSPFICPS